MNAFSENTRVQVPAALQLCKLGYTYLDDIMSYDTRTNILTDVFLRSIHRINPDLKSGAAEEVLQKIVNETNNDDLGRAFYEMLTAKSGIKLIDFDNPDNNEWHVTTEFSCVNDDTQDNFRPDITCFINGLPLAFIEVKKPNNHEGILAEKARAEVRMRNKAYRRFFNITQLMIYSNNQEYDNLNRVPIQGAFYCATSKGKPFFNVFREGVENFVETYPYLNIDQEIENKVLKHRNCVVIKHDPVFETNKNVNTPTNRIITSMLCKERILFLLRYGFVYVKRTKELEDGSQITETEKHVMRYQQLFASLALRNKLSQDIKSGIIWHTQGSGKTALAYYSVKNLTDFYAQRNCVAKFYFIVDRIALMEQAIDEFTARGLLVRTATNREELMADFRSDAIVENSDGKPEIMVVNIQKFKEDHAKVKIDAGYSTNLQRVFFIDEAHRGYSADGSFLANLLDADRDAVKLALTGTPLLKEERESWRVFGDYIDTYYYDKSIADGYTLKLMREPIETIYKERLAEILDKLAGNVEVKKSDIDKDKIIEHESYLTELMNYIIADFRKFRVEQNDDTVGAMIVCKTNAQARELYRLWTERFKNAVRIVEKKEEQAMMVNEDPMLYYSKMLNPLRASLILHDEGDKLERKEYIEEYKKQMSVDVLIVNQMLLTGFDAPRLKKLYLGRKLDGHDLLQALTRVNRPYKDFQYGYVVDFVDIKENFDATNNRYLRELNRTTEDENIVVPADPGSVVIEDKEAIVQKMKEIKSVLFNFTCDNAEEFRQEIDEIEDKEQLYELRTTLNNAKAIINQVRAFGDEELKEKIQSMTDNTSFATLVTEVSHRIDRINLMTSTEHEADVSGIINVVLSELEFEFKKGLSEELKIVVNDLKERAQKVQAEFELNFDKKEDKFVILADEFRKYFRKKGFTPKDVNDAKESIDYMDEVMKKIREINRRNNLLKKKYKGDERFARIHKRVLEENVKREKPIISKDEVEIAESLSRMKNAIDDKIILNWHILANDSAFQQDVLAHVGQQLITLKIGASLDDRKYLRNLIAGEYLQQYSQQYAY